MRATNGIIDSHDQIHWWPGKYLRQSDDNEQKRGKYGIMVLNRPINVPDFAQLWNEATVRTIVDGGMNRFIDYQKVNSEVELHPPDVFSGDFDSCEPASMEYAQSCGCSIVKTPDQNETDFTKALRTVAPFILDQNVDQLIVVCDASGRLDQIMANVNTMFKSSKILPDVELMLLSHNSLAFLLPHGSHVIHVPQYISDAKLWCGLIPFRPTTVTTTGLKWNLMNTVMEFGGMVSTSNTYKKDATEVTVETDNELLWTMGVVAGD